MTELVEIQPSYWKIIRKFLRHLLRSLDFWQTGLNRFELYPLSYELYPPFPLYDDDPPYGLYGVTGGRLQSV